MKVQEAISFSQFIFPFSFEQNIFLELLSAIETLTWDGKKEPYPVWCKEVYPNEELLPHVSRYLNPTSGVPTACIYAIREQALSSDALGHLSYHSKLTFRWVLKTRQGDIPFCVNSIKLSLFQTGIGFLVINAKPLDNRADIATWMNFLHYFRFTKGQRKVQIQGMTCQGDTRREHWRPYFASRAENEEARVSGTGYFKDIVDICLRDLRGGEVWWEELFIDGQLLPYAGLFMQEAVEEEIPLLVYKIRNFHHSAQEMEPAAENMDYGCPALLPYSHNEWFTFSLEGGMFLSFNKPDTIFNTATLPDHLNRHYFLVYLLALHQRFSLMKFSELVARQWIKRDDLTDEAQEGEFERIRAGLLAFMARGYFAQVMQREHHHRYFVKWQETLQVQRLFGDISQVVSDIHRYLEARRSSRLQELAEMQNQQIRQEAEAGARMEKQAQERSAKLERRISLFALILGIPALGLTFIQSADMSGLSQSVWTVVLSFAFGMAFYRGITSLNK